MKILLKKLPWYSNENIWVTGFIREGSRYLSGIDLVEYFSGADDISAFEHKLLCANGHFSVIVKKEEEIWAATDRIRNFPLFYTWINGEFVICDDCYQLSEQLPDIRLDPVAVDCFLTAGYVLNNLTLVSKIYQVEAGEFIIIGTEFKRKFYYNISLYPLINREFHDAAKELVRLTSDIFKNHFEALKDQFVVIPLSGGFDSRLIACMCARYHPDNVLCYTYGTRDNPEVAPAQEVAHRLGFRWINVIYDQDLIKGYLDDSCFREYYPYVSGLSSMFFMQEYFAVKYLKDNELIPHDSVFIPGFCGDVLAGCNLFQALNKLSSTKDISKMIYGEFFRLTLPGRLVRDNILKLICEKLSSEKVETWKIFESWDHKEPKAKFNVNSAKVFSFFGYKYVLPLWDNQFVDFFASLPFEFKFNKKLYDYVLTDEIFREHDLNFSYELNPLPVQKSLQRIKEKVKRYIPSILKDRLIRYNSPVYYDRITGIMLEDMSMEKIIRPLQPNYYNSYICQWYIAKTKKLFSDFQ